MRRLWSRRLITAFLALSSAFCARPEKTVDPSPPVLAVTGVHPACVGEGLVADITIEGRGFDVGTRVMFGKSPATRVTLLNPTQLVASIPPSTGDSSVAVLGPEPGGRVVRLNAIHHRPSTTFDPNGDCTVSPADVVYIINYANHEGPAPVLSGDANGDGKVDREDAQYLLRHLYQKGPAPKPVLAAKRTLQRGVLSTLSK